MVGARSVRHDGDVNALIRAGAAAYAGLGVVSFLRPDVVPATTGGAALPGADARTEVRAVYGGLPLAFAATLARSPSSGTAIGVATLGMAAGRGASALFEGPPSPRMAGFIALEIAVGAALLLGARSKGVRSGVGRLRRNTLSTGLRADGRSETPAAAAWK